MADSQAYRSGQDLYRANSNAQPSGGSSSAHGTGTMVDLPKPKPAPSGPSLAEAAAAAKAKKVAASDKDKPKKVYTTDDLKSYKHGTDYVPKTGPANLHQGEAVLTKEEAKDYRAAKKENSMKNPYEMITKGDKKPAKEIKHIISHKTHDGKIIHTHVHHHPEHHPNEEHVSTSMDDLHGHMDNHFGNPPADGAAPVTASPSPMPEAAPVAE